LATDPVVARIGGLTAWVTLPTTFWLPVIGCLAAAGAAPRLLARAPSRAGSPHFADGFGGRYGGGVQTSSSMLADLMAPDWAEALSPAAERVTEMGRFLRAELAAGRTYLPAGPDILRAFTEPLAAVRVLVVGQDPYPTPGHAVGLSFSVAPHVRPLPRSLQNIFAELEQDLGVAQPTTGDLTPWTKQGVLLLNRVLTVEPGRPASHRGKGWEAVTEQAIRALVARDQPLVALLWGRDAKSLTPILGDTPVVASAHPSPLSAARGFFGSRPFSRINTLLAAQGGVPIDWRLEA